MADVGTPPGGFAESRPHSAWLRDVYPELVAGTLKGPLPHECVQLPGEVVYVPHGWFHAVSNLREGATLAVGAQIVAGGVQGASKGEGRVGRDSGQYFGPQLALVLLQERLIALEAAARSDELADAGGEAAVEGVVAELGELLAEQPRLDGAALSLWNAHALLRATLKGPGTTTEASTEAVRVLRMAADTNPRSVKAQLTLASHLLVVGSWNETPKEQRSAAQQEALHRVEFAWGSGDPEGYQAPALLCKVLSQMTIARLRSGSKEPIPASSWGKLGTVCARASEVMRRSGDAGAEKVMNLLLQMMNSASKMVDFGITMMDFAFKYAAAGIGGGGCGCGAACSVRVCGRPDDSDGAKRE